MEALPKNQKPSASQEPGSGSSTLTSKRTRVVVSQSKRGCVTCKTRRVKCDEQRPLCRRCVRAGRLCGGYNDESRTSSALQPALKFGVSVDSHTERLCYLAAHVLSLDNNGHPLREEDVWGRTFLQLSNQVECVKAAAAAFGAAYELSLNNAIVNDSRPAWRYYGSALARFQSDLNNETAGPESLVLASMTLACVEILSQHEQNAFAHFLGAVEILTKTHERRQEATSTDILNTIQNGLVQINLLISSYGLSQTPQFMYLEPREAAGVGDVLRGPELAIDAAVLCLHRSYQFIQSAAQLRYTIPSWKGHDPIMCKDQSDAVVHCRLVLNGLATFATKLQSQHSSEPTTLGVSETLAEVHALRAQVTSTMVFILCIHSPYETSYDEHLDLFRTIVSDAAASARLRRQTKPSAFKRFLTRPGIVSPLFLVGIKCRDPSLRALATTMLNEQSREGPADGPILAAIGARLAAIEASACVPSLPGAPLAACNIAEEKRVHGYSVPQPRLNSDGSRVIDVVFQRPNPPFVQGQGHVDYSGPDGWMYWSEPIEI